MKQDGFKKLSSTELNKTYGGFWAALATFIPALIGSVAQVIASIKMMGSDSGSYKTKGLEAHWTEKESGSTSKPKEEVNKTVFYAY